MPLQNIVEYAGREGGGGPLSITKLVTDVAFVAIGAHARKAVTLGNTLPAIMAWLWNTRIAIWTLLVRVSMGV